MSSYIQRVKWNIQRLSFMKALWSPFKPFKLKWYIGKTTIGTPYFLPRKWVKCKDKPGYTTPVLKKIGWDFVGLGWKTKWTDTDYRYEWSPIWSFVFFGYQIAVIFVAPEATHYWEAWLYYEYSTNHKLSKKERIKACKENFSLTWELHKSDKKELVNYYDKVLKTKYL